MVEHWNRETIINKDLEDWAILQSYENTFFGRRSSEDFQWSDSGIEDPLFLEISIQLIQLYFIFDAGEEMIWNEFQNMCIEFLQHSLIQLIFHWTIFRSNAIN